MYVTAYKLEEEIRPSLEGCETVALFSCAACANLCNVGGVRGIEYMKDLLIVDRLLSAAVVDAVYTQHVQFTKHRISEIVLIILFVLLVRVQNDLGNVDGVLGMSPDDGAALV